MSGYNWNMLKKIKRERYQWRVAKRISICAIFILPILFYLMKLLIYDSIAVFLIFSIISVVVFLLLVRISSVKIKKINRKIAEINQKMNLITFR